MNRLGSLDERIAALDATLREAASPAGGTSVR
jgi:hypothetical protein